MSPTTNIHVLRNENGEPVFVVIPYADYLSLTKQGGASTENSVIGKVINSDINSDIKSIRDWRLHFGFTQQEMARRLGISRNAFTHYEVTAPVKRSTREKIAGALGVMPGQIDYSKVIL